MAHTEGYTLSAAGSTLKALSCWRVCGFFLLLFVAMMPERVDAAKARCGAELIADLEFVCGDRGFYRGPVGRTSYRGNNRSKGIVEQCCVKGCNLQFLERYCAKPKRGRRETPAATQDD